jgi:hypothetical protein
MGFLCIFILLMHALAVYILISRQTFPPPQDEMPVEYMTLLNIPHAAKTAGDAGARLAAPATQAASRHENQPPPPALSIPDGRPEVIQQNSFSGSNPPSPPLSQEARPLSTAAMPQQNPPLDLDNLRKLALDNDRQRDKHGIDHLREEESLAKAENGSDAKLVGKAIRKDCRTAYSGPTFNVLAIVPLVIDTVTDKGCKW